MRTPRLGARRERGTAFDTGADSSEMLNLAEKSGVKIQLILLTHAHPDHIADLARLKQKTGAPVYISSYEPADGSEAITEEGKSFKIGKLHDIASDLGLSAAG